MELSRSFFDAFALELVNSLEEEATSGKPTKTHAFYWFFACPRLRARCENRPKIIPNTLLDRVARWIAFESPETSKWSPKGSLGRLWTLLSGSWGALEHSCGALGRSWGALGTVLGRSWGALGALLDALGRSWDALGALLDPPGRSWLDFGASEGRF